MFERYPGCLETGGQWLVKESGWWEEAMQSTVEHVTSSLCKLETEGPRIHGYSKKEQGKRKSDVKAQHETYSRYTEDKTIPEDWLEEKEQLKEMPQELGVAHTCAGSASGARRSAARSRPAAARRLKQRRRLQLKRGYSPEPEKLSSGGSSGADEERTAIAARAPPCAGCSQSRPTRRRA
ncbi:hypothetical protein WJX81_002176 [Elliptochloris bilobata]|uniref:Uncharacterized protein n=1 Tax=Elliptochloris bilobata TaxID=381761 RepID=A0AAW1S0A0_9CHLO